MKIEIDYVVKQDCSNAMTVLKKYTDRMKMLYENPNVDKTKFIVIEDEKTFSRYNEIDGKEMKWIADTLNVVSAVTPINTKTNDC